MKMTMLTSNQEVLDALEQAIQETGTRCVESAVYTALLKVNIIPRYDVLEDLTSELILMLLEEKGLNRIAMDYETYFRLQDRKVMNTDGKVAFIMPTHVSLEECLKSLVHYFANRNRSYLKKAYFDKGVSEYDSKLFIGYETTRDLNYENFVDDQAECMLTMQELKSSIGRIEVELLRQYFKANNRMTRKRAIDKLKARFEAQDIQFTYEEMLKLLDDLGFYAKLWDYIAD